MTSGQMYGQTDGHSDYYSASADFVNRQHNGQLLLIGPYCWKPYIHTDITCDIEETQQT